MTQHDSAAWAHARGGDGEAFGLLFDRHRPRVQPHLARLLSSPHDVEDAVAIVFLEAWRRRDAVRVVEGSIMPWLLVTATNVANNVRRSGRHYQALLDRLPPVGDTVIELTAVEEPEVLTALRGLSLQDQQVLTLCVLEDWSEREAAEALRVRPGTVKSRLHRAKRRLADSFGALTAAPLKGATNGL